MTQPTQPPYDPALATAIAGLTPDQIRAALTAPNMRDKLLNSRAPAGKLHTVDEAMKLAENMANALDRSTILPITTTTTRETDGTLTIRVTAQDGNTP